MKCPSCNTDLLIADRQNIEIDFCPKCRGVWLDRGELDKIIERTVSWKAEKYDDDDSHEHARKPYPRKQKSLLGELFDF